VAAKTYSVADARARLAEIVDQVEAGREVEITRRGRRVAVVVSASRYARLRAEPTSFWRSYEGFSKKHDLTELGLERSWAEDTRDRSSGREVKL
jgi:prevent-host-death family protein